ncbi:hypothetical protein BHE74_00017934 [Ensete ventricosum]|nr:hypothetical protein BHE74_00017934 [Ensete ventricosum]
MGDDPRKPLLLRSTALRFSRKTRFFPLLHPIPSHRVSEPSPRFFLSVDRPEALELRFLCGSGGYHHGIPRTARVLAGGEYHRRRSTGEEFDLAASSVSSPKPEEHGSQDSVEIAVNKAAEEQEEMVDRLRGALLEVRKSADVSGGSKRLLGSLVEVAIGDVGDDPLEENGLRDSALCAKVWIGIVCFLILQAALMNLLAISTMLIGSGGRDLSGLPPPT